ncbi:hypothetical protein ACQP1S_20755 [Micromonospora matsumotoense]|uniref:hypothetical protein n=1 Tax=Micromonospora matsumotoense TaxID=121616 RepID=UPI003D8EAA47
MDAIGLDQAGQPRFRLHEVTRRYAGECLDRQIEATDWTEALSRVAAAWLALARHVQQQLRCERLHLDDPSIPAALDAPRVVDLARRRPIDWFESEREP